MDRWSLYLEVLILNHRWNFQLYLLIHHITNVDFFCFVYFYDANLSKITLTDADKGGSAVLLWRETRQPWEKKQSTVWLGDHNPSHTLALGIKPELYSWETRALNTSPAEQLTTVVNLHHWFSSYYLVSLQIDVIMKPYI